MEPWKIYAFVSAIFAGLTSVLAKSGLKTLPPDLGLAVRITVIFVLIILNTMMWHGVRASGAYFAQAGGRAFTMLALSGLTTTLSWICYYRAMAIGTVSFVSLVDKGSILVTMLLAVVVLGEPFTWRMALGGAMIVGGLLVLAWK